MIIRENILNDLLEYEGQLWDDQVNTKHEKSLIEWHYGEIEGNVLPSKEEYMKRWNDIYSSKTDTDLALTHRELLSLKYED